MAGSSITRIRVSVDNRSIDNQGIVNRSADRQSADHHGAVPAVPTGIVEPTAMCPGQHDFHRAWLTTLVLMTSIA